MEKSIYHTSFKSYKIKSVKLKKCLPNSKKGKVDRHLHCFLIFSKKSFNVSLHFALLWNNFLEVLSLSENNCICSTYLFNYWRCEQGLIPLQDSIEGCVECINDSDCLNDQFCEVNWVGKSANRFNSHKCKPKHKPCEPSPCGKWTCMVIDDEEVCRFLLICFLRHKFS